MLRALIHKFQPIVYPLVKWYYRKPRNLIVRGIKIRLYPSVFHPNLYLSTHIFLDYLLTLPLENKTLMEVGAGNGLISLYLAKNKHCEVTSTDINPKAISGLTENSQRNNVVINVVESDLFQQVPYQKTDYIVVNPPYYASDISSVDEYAFFAGEELQYFSRFFQQIQPYLEDGSCVLMILSEHAPLSNITHLAHNEGIAMTVRFKVRKLEEDFLIYLAHLT